MFKSLEYTIMVARWEGAVQFTLSILVFSGTVQQYIIPNK